MKSSEITENSSAPDFVLMDSEGRQVRLSNYRGGGETSFSFSTAAFFDHTAAGTWRSCAGIIRNS